jgi:membrane-associated phospholipid phosphatase
VFVFERGFFTTCRIINEMNSPNPSRLRRFAAARLSVDGAAGLYLTVGVAVLVVTAWIFGVIAGQVTGNGPLTLLDLRVANWFHAHATPGVTRVMLVFTHWNSVAGVLVMTAILGYALYRRKFDYWLLALVVTVPGGMIVNVLMKLAFERARPVFDVPLVTLHTFSFPSGHASGAALFYGFLACMLMRRAVSGARRVALAGAAAVMVAAVCFSRVYLGAHYLTDVLAGVAEGLAWLAICLTATSHLRRRRAARGLPLWRKS